MLYTPNRQTKLYVFLGKYKIYVELVSRVEPDTLYRLDAQSYSSINIRGQQHNFAQAGHHFIVLDPKTGKFMHFYKHIAENRIGEGRRGRGEGRAATCMYACIYPFYCFYRIGERHRL
jgi:hypothetical protein